MALAFSSFKSSNVKTITVQDRVKKKRWALEHEDDAVRAEKWAGIRIASAPRRRGQWYWAVGFS